MLMRRSGVVRVFALMAVILLGSNLAFSIEARDIIAKSEDALRGKTQVMDLEVRIKTPKWERTMRLKSWENRLAKKSFSEIVAPAKDAGNRFLLINKQMRHYVPKLQKVIKLSASMMLQSWMGSDFSNDDILKESSILKDYYHTLAGQDTVAGFECYRVILHPKPKAAVVWGKIVYYARLADFLPVRQEFYNDHNVLKKVMSFKEFRQMGGRTIPTVYRMRSVKKKNRYTEITVKSVRFNLKIPPKMFSLQNLKRR